MFNAQIAEEAKALLRARLAKRLGYIEQLPGDSDFLFAERFGIADACLFTIIAWAEDLKVTLDNFPAIRRRQQLIAQRPAMQQAIQAETQFSPVA